MISFLELSDTGTLIYNSSKINKTILELLPEGWNKTDINALNKGEK